MHKDINVNVSGPAQPASTYKTYVLKGQVPFATQVTEPNTKYVIKHNFDLGGESVTIPEGCLLEFDGGAISNGTLVGQNTILIYNQPLNDILTATLEGTWRHESGVKADEEDITDLNGELKFKDKAYAPANYSGLGRKYLRKNLVNGVNTLTQSMINDANTIYVIQYDFTLGENITVPANCVLEFDGGSLSNGTLVGQNTIVLGCKNAFALDCVLDGTFSADIADSEWFSIADDCVLGSNLEYISGTNNNQGLINLFKFRNINIKNGTYYTSSTDRIHPLSGTVVNGNNATIKCFGAEYISFIQIYQENVSISNITLIGSREDSSTSVDYQQSHGIEICNKVARIQNVISKNFKGDGFYIGPASSGGTIPENVIISNCVSDNNYRQGLSITGGKNIDITNSKFINTNGTAPQAGIDIEPNVFSDVCEEISIKNCLFYDSVGHAILIQGIIDEAGDNFNVKNVVIENCIVNKSINILSCENITVKDCLIKIYGVILNNNRKRNISILNNTFNGLTSLKGSTPNNLFSIYSSSSSNYSENVLVFGNKMSFTSGYAIQVPNNVVCKGLILENNTINNCKNSIFVGDGATNVLYKCNKIINHGIKYNGESYGWGWKYYKGDDITTRIDLDTGLYGENLNEGVKQKGTMVFNTSFARPQWLANDGNYYDADLYKVDFTHGATGSRPTLAENTNKGYRYFDTTIRKPIWWRDYWWIEADGAKADVKRTGTFAEKPYEFDCYIGFTYFCTDRKIDMDSSSPTYLQVITPTSPDTGGMPIFHKGNYVWVDAFGRVVS